MKAVLSVALVAGLFASSHAAGGGGASGLSPEAKRRNDYYKVRDQMTQAHGFRNIATGGAFPAYGYWTEDKPKTYPQSMPYGTPKYVYGATGRFEVAGNFQEQVDRYYDNLGAGEKVDHHKVYGLERGRDMFHLMGLTDVASLMTNDKFTTERSIPALMWYESRQHSLAKAEETVDYLYHKYRGDYDNHHEEIAYAEGIAGVAADYALSQGAYLVGESELAKIALITAASKGLANEQHHLDYYNHKYYKDPSEDNAWNVYKSESKIGIYEELLAARLFSYQGNSKWFNTMYYMWQESGAELAEETGNHYAEKYYKNYGHEWDEYFDYDY